MSIRRFPSATGKPLRTLYDRVDGGASCCGTESVDIGTGSACKAPCWGRFRGGRSTCVFRSLRVWLAQTWRTGLIPISRSSVVTGLSVSGRFPDDLCRAAAANAAGAVCAIERSRDTGDRWVTATTRTTSSAKKMENHHACGIGMPLSATAGTRGVVEGHRVKT
jgi:hypothetical protein